jgi:tetratricopeptide (TPR) repeat protein
MSSDSSTSISTDAGVYVVSPAMRRRLQQCYDHASKLAKQEKYDHDYANTLFTECVVNDPNNLIYVEAFLDNLQRKYNNNKKGGRMLGFGGAGNLKKLLAKEDYAAVLKQGPEALKTNPWDVPTLRAMAEACAALGYNEVELRYLKNALEANPKDVEVNRHCAQSLARVGQFDQAMACWHRVEEGKKGDKEAPKAISELTVEKQRIRQGMPRTLGAGMGAAASKAVAYAQAAAKVAPQPKPEPAPQFSSESEEAAEAPRREIQRTPRQLLEQAIVADPTELPNYLKLAELLAEETRYGEAEHVLTKALAVSGSDLRIRERLEDMQLEKARAQVVVAERRAEVEKTDEARELARQMRSDVNRRETEVLYSRVMRYPEKTALKHELGLRLKRAGNYAEAIKYFQEARETPGVKAAATLEMGECLQQLKQYAKALECYTRAAEVAGENLEHKKLALYRAGVLATGMRELDVADKHLLELAALDPAYKDVPDRLDKVRRIRNSG